MRRMLALLAIGAATVSVLAASAGAASPSVQVVIRHAVRGCHVWAVNSGTYSASHRISVAPGTRFTFTDNDVMMHRVVQLAGPKVSVAKLVMNKIGAQSSLRLFAKGKYVFSTKFGEDYKGVHVGETIGEDNTLKLIVIVR